MISMVLGFLENFWPMKKPMKKENCRFVYRPSDSGYTNSLVQQLKQALRDVGGKCGPVRLSACIAAYPDYQAGTYP